MSHSYVSGSNTESWYSETGEESEVYDTQQEENQPSSLPHDGTDGIPMMPNAAALFQQPCVGNEQFLPPLQPILQYTSIQTPSGLAPAAQLLLPGATNPTILSISQLVSAYGYNPFENGPLLTAQLPPRPIINPSRFSGPQPVFSYGNNSAPYRLAPAPHPLSVLEANQILPGSTARPCLANTLNNGSFAPQIPPSNYNMRAVSRPVFQTPPPVSAIPRTLPAAEITQVLERPINLNDPAVSAAAIYMDQMLDNNVPAPDRSNGGLSAPEEAQDEVIDEEDTVQSDSMEGSEGLSSFGGAIPSETDTLSAIEDTSPPAGNDCDEETGSMEVDGEMGNIDMVLDGEMERHNQRLKDPSSIWPLTLEQVVAIHFCKYAVSKVGWLVADEDIGRAMQRKLKIEIRRLWEHWLRGRITRYTFTASVAGFAEEFCMPARKYCLLSNFVTYYKRNVKSEWARTTQFEGRGQGSRVRGTSSNCLT